MVQSIREEESEMKDVSKSDDDLESDPEPDLDSEPIPRNWCTAMQEVKRLREENTQLQEENLIMKGELLDAARGNISIIHFPAFPA